MRKKINIVLSVLFIAFIFAIFAGTMVKYGKNYAYGFFKSYKEEITPDASLYEEIRARINKLESNAGQRLIFRNDMREMNAYFQSLIGKDMLNIGSNYTVQLKYGGYYDLFTGAYDTEKTDELVNFAKKLKEEKGIPTVFVYCHCGLYEEEELHEIYRDFDNNNECADVLLKAFEDGGVICIDSREAYQKASLSIDQAVMRTDIHWTHRMALETAAETVRKMNSALGFSFDEDKLKYGNFNVETHEKLLYGEIAQRLGEAFMEEDDISIMTPKYDTHIVYEAENEGTVRREGTFEEAIVERRKIENDSEGAYEGKKNTQAYYVYGDYLAKTHTVNEDAAPVKILVFKDSYGTPVASFLSLTMRDVYAVDLRSSDMSMNEWVETVQPDAVLFAYSQQMLRNFDYVIAD
ncbi:MAG: hypothetical protein IJB99_05450 [Clostridia bacterium]|nr:hypothetical protein [Clostridia bacterium]MBQ3169187.1 hypothetical protein [Clostridia bacterium]